MPTTGWWRGLCAAAGFSGANTARIERRVREKLSRKRESGIGAVVACTRVSSGPDEKGEQIVVACDWGDLADLVDLFTALLDGGV
jgi:hypothetical protein